MAVKIRFSDFNVIVLISELNFAIGEVRAKVSDPEISSVIPPNYKTCWRTEVVTKIAVVEDFFPVKDPITSVTIPEKVYFRSCAIFEHFIGNCGLKVFKEIEKTETQIAKVEIFCAKNTSEAFCLIPMSNGAFIGGIITRNFSAKDFLGKDILAWCLT